MRKSVTRLKGREFCVLEVELREREKGKELSICGTYGEVISTSQAKRQALEYWVSYFEDSPEAIIDINKRFNKRFTSARGAAKFVIQCDGEFHGLDVVKETDNKVFVCYSCGQIREELERFFPEAKPYFQYHLNGMNAGCPHQKKLSWGNGKDIALTAETCTEVQLEVLQENFRSKIFKNCLMAPCPECGYQYGSNWLFEPLPKHVIDWVESL